MSNTVRFGTLNVDDAMIMATMSPADDAPMDHVGVVEYPTRKSFIDMQSLPSFQASHHHKDAGMESRIVIEDPADVGPGRAGRIRIRRLG